MPNYKKVWNNLSDTFSGARYVVGYLGEEESIRENGRITTEFLISALKIEPTDKVLEIGCGIARIGRELAPHCGEWHGSDISGNMIDHAQQRTEGIPNVYLHELPETDLGIFNDGYFDCVYSTIVFMHLDKIEMFNYMREAYRVLAPGGRAYFDTYNIMASEAWGEFIKIIEAYPPGQRPNHTSQFSSVPEMHKFMTEAGFSDIEVDDQNPQLVVARGKKPDQPGYERPTTVINEQAMARIRDLEARGYIDMSRIDHNLGVKIIDGRSIISLDYGEWDRIHGHLATKDTYIAELEAALREKNKHITTLESRVRKQERMMSPLPVRVALRLSKHR